MRHFPLSPFKALACATAAALLVAGTLTACGGASESTDAVDPVANAEELLHKVNIGAHEVTFLLSHPAGDAAAGTIIMKVQGPDTVDPVAELERAEGPMTFLEVLKAVAPNETPRPEMVKLHAEQAKALDRADVQQLKAGLAEAGARLQAGTPSRTPCSTMKGARDTNSHTLPGPEATQTIARLACVDSAQVTSTSTDLSICKFKTPRTLVLGGCVANGALNLRLLAFRNSNDGNGFIQMNNSIINPGTFVRVEIPLAAGTTKQTGAAVGLPIAFKDLPTLGNTFVYTATK